MKILLAILIMIVVFSTSSCTVAGTLYPITANDKDFVIKNELIGKWWDAGDSTYYFSIDTLPGYKGQYFKVYTIEVDVENKKEDTIFPLIGILTSIDGWHFFECWVDIKGKIEGTVVPMHFVYRLSFPADDKIDLNDINVDELLKLIDQKKIHLTYAESPANLKYSAGYDYLILDKTPALRKALMETKKYPKVYHKEKITLTRLQGSLY
jgi:hypothetical protein